ncbi:MAG: Phosphonate ABC transporter phosphate-binding periplasmic component [Candidatus Ozemobacter sibiricus]|jgi:phosphonate transport system substrate-binding protein|uniref:Phosphonate ABC transporter phosphate-binding periplasmic component n=1 Tax=Candidatus Ozemobacter sibiricus TaxID=2268124 RepID=A0A367ZB03_9BACT|nr:MAG: Phosphonate ABC transporter phosphate-binding periplasmic component [Candidatus Ozemobacter sibiricus]
MRKLLSGRAIALFGIGVFLVATFLIIGCGGSGSPPPASSPGAGSNPSSAPAAGRGSAYADTVLKIGRIPFTNATEMVRKHEELMKYLRQELGVKETRLVLASDYNGIMTKLSRGEIDIAWLGTLTYAENMGKVPMRLLVKPVRFGTTSYRGIIITRGDSGIRTLADLKGKKFAWVEKDSASGYIFPKALLIEAGVNPDKDFAEASFLQKHDSVVLNVLLGKYDAGACYDDARKTLREKEKMDELTILATTQDISNEPIVCRQDLPEDLAEKIRQAFLKLKIDDPQYKKVLEDCTDVQGFMPAADADYEYTRKVYELLKNRG